jgi:hypothetical protein
MGVVDDAVEDGVGERWIADDVVPAVDGDLAGDHGGAAAVALLDDLEEIAALLGRERPETPVVEDEEFDAAEGAHEAGIAAVAAGEREVGEAEE